MAQFVRNFETLELKIAQEGYESEIGKALGNLIAAKEEYESVLDGSGSYKKNPERILFVKEFGPEKIQRMTKLLGWKVYNLSGKIKKTEGYRLVKWLDNTSDETMYALGKEVIDYFYN